ncbi:MAG: MarR family transcriptional regulator [Candidatus Omnitrophica bacterium]|nr:MarR family transcriptional regulator [Candidatus Omnitrophota bacterium]
MDYLKGLGIEVGRGNYYEEAIYGTILLYNRINSEIGIYLDQFDLSPAKFNVLMVIKHRGSEEGISQVEISKRLLVTASNMTRLIDKLEDEKLIERFAQEGDRRVNLIRVTQRAAKLLDDIWPGYIEKLKDLMKDMSKEDQIALSGLSLKWLNTLVE